jgi:hypothetical protein
MPRWHRRALVERRDGSCAGHAPPRIVVRAIASRELVSAGRIEALSEYRAAALRHRQVV